MKIRIKYCGLCNVNFSVMYRIQYKNPKKWIFVCKDCLIKVRENNNIYKYGGTWKKQVLNLYFFTKIVIAIV